jgi:Cu(I)/Ag(I) efflux system membrane fusion protein
MNKKVAIGFAAVLTVAAFAVGRYTGSSREKVGAGSKRIAYYVDPMHPAYHSDKPGIAPDCGMALVPVYEGEDPSAKLQLPAGAVWVSPEKQQLVGVHVERVAKSPGSRMIRTTGRVVIDESRLFRMVASTEGWVQTVGNNPAGTFVKKNDVIATFYSREFRTEEQGYIVSLAGLDRTKTTARGKEGDDQLKQAENTLHVSEMQLRALGMGDPQIAELGKTRQPTTEIQLVSPVDGFVLSRNILPQQRFEHGTELCTIADISKVWILADFFGDEAQIFRPGTKVKATTLEVSRTFTATVSVSRPVFDANRRTLTLRLDAENPDLLLRPDMYVNLEISAEVPAGLSVSAEAVLDAGTRKIVYVEPAENVFEPRTIETGMNFGDRVMITRGLADGDRVVTSGNFLLDSESRMRSESLPSAKVVPAKETSDNRPLDVVHVHESSHK